MNPTLTDLLAEVEELDRTASKGVWTFEPRRVVPGYAVRARERPDTIGRVVAEVPKYAGTEEADVRLVSRARTLLPDFSRRLNMAMEAIGLLTSNGDPCETCYEEGCTGNSPCYGRCRDGGDQTCHDRAYARKQKASALIREIKEPSER